MKVSELATILQRCNPDAEVRLWPVESAISYEAQEAHVARQTHDLIIHFDPDEMAKNPPTPG